jgi:hypothetical protein
VYALVRSTGGRLGSLGFGEDFADGGGGQEIVGSDEVVCVPLRMRLGFGSIVGESSRAHHVLGLFWEQSCATGAILLNDALADEAHGRVYSGQSPWVAWPEIKEFLKERPSE